MDRNNKPWFPKKKIGVGWGLPITWQGWIVLILYLLLSFIGAMKLTNPPIRVPFFFLYFFLLTAAFIFICWKKGAKID